LNIKEVNGEKCQALESCVPKVQKLFVRGNSSLLDNGWIGRRVAIVGTRAASRAGLHDARRIAQVVALAGGIVVSGMALGIDGAAHRGTLDVAGETIAVLGSGVDVIYPSRHQKLAHEIIEHGCIVSEYEPGTNALAWHFPIRNRIIAALSDLLVVPEGTIKGGARITVDLALAMGKTVCALPGPRRNPASELCNTIIADGALCINDPADVLRELGIETDDVGWDLVQQSTAKRELTSIENKVMYELAHRPLHSSDIGHYLSVPASTVSKVLSRLETDGFITYRRGMFEIA
jgi:DNA processing protein